MSNHCELRDVRSEGIHSKNKYKFMILKITLIPQTIYLPPGDNPIAVNKYYYYYYIQ